MSQNYKIWIGAELLGCTRGRTKSVLNAVTYRVTKVVDGHVHFAMSEEFQAPVDDSTQCVDDTESTGDDDEKEEEDLSLTFDECAALMRPTHCLVYYTSQGRTLKDRNVLLLDVTQRYFTLRHFIVGVSRATSGNRLGIATDLQQQQLMQQKTVTVPPNPIDISFSPRDFLL